MPEFTLIDARLGFYARNMKISTPFSNWVRTKSSLNLTCHTAAGSRQQAGKRKHKSNRDAKQKKRKCSRKREKIKIKIKQQLSPINMRLSAAEPAAAAEAAASRSRSRSRSRSLPSGSVAADALRAVADDARRWQHRRLSRAEDLHARSLSTQLGKTCGVWGHS